MTPETRTDLPATNDERDMITTFLDYARATVHAKCAGLSDDDARATPVASSPLMSISGLVSHLHWVEYSWFQVVFLGEEDHGPWTDEEPDREMTFALGTPIAQVLAEYEAQCERYRRLVADTELDALSVRTGRGGQHFTMKWIVLHLVEETSRHNGHLDIVRELVDGVTGT